VCACVCVCDRPSLSNVEEGGGAKGGNLIGGQIPSDVRESRSGRVRPSLTNHAPDWMRRRGSREEVICVHARTCVCVNLHNVTACLNL